MITLAAIFSMCAVANLLHVHQERTVAVDVNDLFIRAGNFRAERGWVAETHRAQPALVEKLAGFFEFVILRGPTSGAGRRRW